MKMVVNMYEWVENIENKIKNKEMVDLLEDLPIKKDLWLKNFVKTAMSTTLIALSFNFIFDGFHKHPHDNNEILLGIVAFLIAMLVIFIIDKYHQKVRELELRSINANMNLQGNIPNNTIIPNQQPLPPNINDYLINKNYIDEKVESYIKEQLKKVILEDG